MTKYILYIKMGSNSTKNINYDELVFRYIEENDEIKKNAYFVLKTDYNIKNHLYKSHFQNNVGNNYIETYNELYKNTRKNFETRMWENYQEIMPDFEYLKSLECKYYIIFDKNCFMRYILSDYKIYEDGTGKFDIFSFEDENILEKISKKYLKNYDFEKLRIIKNNDIVCDVINLCIDINNHNLVVEQHYVDKKIKNIMKSTIKKYNKKNLKHKKGKKEENNKSNKFHDNIKPMSLKKEL